MELCVVVFVYLGTESHDLAPASRKLTVQTKPASHLQPSSCLILLRRPPHPLDSRLSRETPAVSRGGKRRLTGCGRNLSFQGEEKKETSVTASSGDEAATEGAPNSESGDVIQEGCWAAWPSKTCYDDV